MLFWRVGFLVVPGDLLAAIRRSNEAHGPRFVWLVVIVVAVQSSYRLGDMVTGVGNRELVGMATATRETATDIAGTR